MNAFSSFALRGLALLVLLGLPMKSLANSCRDRNESYQYLPERIGDPGSREKIPFPLNCDTVEVGVGKRTEVEAGAMLHFTRPQSGNIIHVRGTLVIKGNKETWVYLSGSIDMDRGKMEPGKAAWGGILVEPGGRLIMEYAGVWGASTAITAFSPDIRIKNSFFTGSTGILKPDGELLELEPTFAAVNDLDFSLKAEVAAKSSGQKLKARPSEPEGLTAEEKTALLAKSAAKPFWTKNRIWASAGAVAVTASGLIYLAQSSEDGGNGPKLEPARLAPMPSLPE